MLLFWEGYWLVVCLVVSFGVIGCDCLDSGSEFCCVDVGGVSDCFLVFVYRLIWFGFFLFVV